ncbi:MAG: aldo/keto reductase [Chloroflexota bacterium]
MRQVRLGRTGLMVSAVGFGGIPIQRLDDDGAVQVVRHCLDAGVTFLDTAHGYTTSEARIGRAIAGRREGLVLATKTHALDAAALRADLEQSFRALGVAYIDLFQFHNVSTRPHLEAVLAPGGLLEIVQGEVVAGRIGHVGVTSHSLDMARELVDCGEFETLMFPFNFIADEPARELLPLCRARDMGLIAMKPMGGGLLGDATLAIQFLRQFPDVLPLVGIERAEEMDEIAAIMAGPAAMTDAERAAIARLRAELGERFCRRCGYCQPCPQEIDIPTIMNFRSFYKRFPPERFFGPWGAVAIAKAEQCADCGECESRCPYHLPIREMMREIVAWYRQEEMVRQKR